MLISTSVNLGISQASMGEKEWYFFSLRDRKYPTGLRTNRATEAGYWKTTGKDKEIFRGAVLVGMKKTLVFYKGRAPRGEKSNWVMHEYRLENKHPFKRTKEEWVVCRVFQKSSAAKKPQQTQSSQQSLGSPCDTNSIVNEFGDIELPNLNNNVNSSNEFNNISTQSNYSNQANVDMNINVQNWASPSLSWPSSLLSPNLAINSLLLKALQLRSYQQREAAAAAANAASSSDHYSFLTQGTSIPQFGTDLNSNVQGSSSSSRVLETVQQPVQQEQPFILDSIW
ncbi:hypothetical protein MANES_05G112755v8 [Manihot esculenta]|uniref:Uncharacterized protein n=1 Tax=Manihot esculenta TaxID=3983 RepID=A0ACB7HNJ5_MANES|nr:hypothetical protein MANES_05G112755v8 [Manihot esculenta]